MKNKQKDISWGIKSLTTLFGFEQQQQDNLTNQSIKFQKSSGILLVKNNAKFIEYQKQPYYQKSKKKWQQLMKFPSKSCKKDIIELLKLDISLHQNIWLWLLQNHQKITPKLYNIRKNQFITYLNSQKQYSIIKGLKNLPQTINNQSLCHIIGSFLMHREDISFNVTLFNIAATFYYYTLSNQLTTYLFIAHLCVSKMFLGFMVKDYQSKHDTLQYINKRVFQHCPSVAFLTSRKNIKVLQFIEIWIQSFFFSICENGSKLKQKVLIYLLVEQFSILSISRICQATIISLAKILNQGNIQKSIQVLNNPKLYLDQGLYLDYLLN